MASAARQQTIGDGSPIIKIRQRRPQIGLYCETSNREQLIADGAFIADVHSLGFLVFEKNAR